jgi:hypothetical protein
MDMGGHAFAGVMPVVYDNAVACFLNASRLAIEAAVMSKCPSMAASVSKRRPAGQWPFWDDRTYWRLRIDVANRDALVVLVDDLGRTSC